MRDVIYYFLLSGALFWIPLLAFLFYIQHKNKEQPRRALKLPSNRRIILVRQQTEPVKFSPREIDESQYESISAQQNKVVRAFRECVQCEPKHFNRASEITPSPSDTAFVRRLSELSSSKAEIEDALVNSMFDYAIEHKKLLQAAKTLPQDKPNDILTAVLPVATSGLNSLAQLYLQLARFQPAADCTIDDWYVSGAAYNAAQLKAMTDELTACIHEHQRRMADLERISKHYLDYI